SIVNANGWTASAGYQVDWGPAMRMVVDLSDLDSSTWVNQTGQSGHAYHGHYDDQIDAWVAGEQFPWPHSEEAVREAASETLILNPRECPAADDVGSVDPADPRSGEHRVHRHVVGLARQSRLAPVLPWVQDADHRCAFAPSRQSLVVAAAALPHPGAALIDRQPRDEGDSRLRDGGLAHGLTEPIR